jgi:hypothetical protein
MDHDAGIRAAQVGNCFSSEPRMEVVRQPLALGAEEHIRLIRVWTRRHADHPSQSALLHWNCPELMAALAEKFCDFL